MKPLFDFLSSTIGYDGLIVIKPGFEQYQEAIISKFQDAGWRIKRMRTTRLVLEQAHKLYEPHKDKDFYEDLCKYMCSGPCTAIVLTKVYNDLSGDPLKEIAEIKDEIRKKWSESEMRNVIHSTDDPGRLKAEIEIFF